MKVQKSKKSKVNILHRIDQFLDIKGLENCILCLQIVEFKGVKNAEFF
jgi:hypothetical protein